MDDRRKAKAREPGATLGSYADDPYTWALEQADLLRHGRLDFIDTVNLADEIAALAHDLADKLRSDLSRIFQHLLKWDYQPDRRSRCWVLSIREHRRRVASIFRMAQVCVQRFRSFWPGRTRMVVIMRCGTPDLPIHPSRANALTPAMTS